MEGKTNRPRNGRDCAAVRDNLEKDNMEKGNKLKEHSLYSHPPFSFFADSHCFHVILPPTLFPELAALDAELK